MTQVTSPKFFKDYKKLFRLFESGKVFCAFDTETTGLSYKTDNVIEIGSVKFDRTGELGKFGSLAKVDFPLPKIIKKITGITDQMLFDAPKIKEVLEEFLEFSAETILVAHNAAFDWNFVNQELIRAGLPQLKNKIVDTLSLSRWAYPLNKKHSQSYLAAGMKISVESAHRAWCDARVCKEIFLRILSDTKSVQEMP